MGPVIKTNLETTFDLLRTRVISGSSDICVYVLLSLTKSRRQALSAHSRVQGALRDDLALSNYTRDGMEGFFKKMNRHNRGSGGSSTPSSTLNAVQRCKYGPENWNFLNTSILFGAILRKFFWICELSHAAFMRVTQSLSLNGETNLEAIITAGAFSRKFSAESQRRNWYFIRSQTIRQPSIMCVARNL